jgi:hypothetical protein
MAVTIMMNRINEPFDKHTKFSFAKNNFTYEVKSNPGLAIIVDLAGLVLTKSKLDQIIYNYLITVFVVSRKY